MSEVLWNMLFGVQMRSFWNLWEQARVSLLQRQAQQEGQTQMPLIPSTHVCCVVYVSS